jgi:beta-galactosidase
VLRRGGDLEAWWRTTALRAGVRWGDWGPYDYYRTFNLTYPFQGWVDLSHGVTGLRLPAAGTRVGVRGTARTLDGYSPNALTFGSTGAQYELATYVEAKL